MLIFNWESAFGVTPRTFIFSRHEFHRDAAQLCLSCSLGDLNQSAFISAPLSHIISNGHGKVLSEAVVVYIQLLLD